MTGFNDNERAPRREVSLIPASAMTPGERMRQAPRGGVPSLQQEIRDLIRQREALADTLVVERQADNPTTPRSGLTPSGSPYEVAMSLEGLTERRRDGSLNPLIAQFHAVTEIRGLDGDDAWCASFMNWCLLMGGNEHLMTFSPRARSFTTLPEFRPLSNGDISADTLMIGDILVFSRGKNPALGHVAFNAQHSWNGPTYDCLGGNQDNKVCVKPYPGDRLLGYIPVS